MNVNKFLLFVLFITLLCVPAHAFQIGNPTNPSPNQTNSQEDELSRHLSAAETYQLAGNLEAAEIENKAIVAISLQRMGNIAIREGDLKRAAELLNESLILKDTSEVRTNLAIAYMSLRQNDDAIVQAQNAVNLDPKNARAQQTLGKLYYLKDNYSAALPALERAIVLQPDFDAAYTLGMTYLRLKQLNRAKLLFEEMQLALKPSPRLHILFGQAFEETNYPAEAEREFNEALVLDPKIPGAHFYLGYLILQNGGSERLNESGKQFEQELLLSPQDAFSNFFAGVVASSNNEHQKAVHFLQESIRLNPTIGPAYLFLGQSQIELNDDASAEKNLRRSIDLTDDASKNSYQIRRAHFLLGRLLNKAGRKEEGEKELAKARELQGQLVESAREEIRKVLGQVATSSAKVDPAGAAVIGAKNDKIQIPADEAAQLQSIKSSLTEILAQSYHNLAVIAVQQNRAEEALTKFAAASQWKADFPGLDRNWGIVAFNANQFETAVNPLSRQVKANPNDLLTRRMLAVSYYFTKNFKQVAEVLKPIEATIGADAELAYFYGISLVQIERHPEAAKIFAQIAAQNPTVAQARFYAGQGFVLVGDYEKAIKEFRDVSTLEPQTLQAHFSAGQSLIRLNRLEEAEKEFRLESQLNPSDESAKYHIAYTMLERKVKIDEALALLREAIAAKFDYADARYQLGKALIERGELPEAITQLEIAAQTEPKKDYIRYQLSIAYRKSSRTADADRELKLYSQLKAANRSETPAGMQTQKNEP